MIAYWMIQVIIPVMFSVGLGLILFNFIRELNLTRITRLTQLRRYRIKSRWQLWLEKWRKSEESTKSGRKLKELLKLAGDPMGLTVFRFQCIKLCLILVWTVYLGGLYLTRFIGSGSLVGIPFIPFTLGALIAWFMPDLVLALLARRRKTIILFEISRLSHRLTLCISEKSELREVIQRAGRTLTLLKPYLHELSVQWNKNQYEAILQLGRKVGLTEIYPLVNTLVAVSHVERGEVARMLEQQVSNIDKTLEHEMQKKIENAPLLIIFLIMIPFLVVFVLMIYPWIAYLSDQLSTSFGGG
jgi:flagellar basal body-associated protein FliL